MENPRRSRLWMVPQIAALAQLSEAKFCQFNYCQFGTDYQKETIILAWNNPLFYENRMTCTSKWIGKFPKRCKSPCSKTGKHHVVLKGVDENQQKYKTATACEYPRELCEYWAKLIIQNAIDPHSVLKTNDEEFTCSPCMPSDAGGRPLSDPF